MTFPNRGGRLWLCCAMFWPCATLTGCTALVAPAQQGPATEYSQRCSVAMMKQAGAVPNANHMAPAVPTPLASSRFSPDVLLVAEIIGAISILNEIAELTLSHRQESVEMLIRRQRLTIASIVIGGIAGINHRRHRLGRRREHRG